MPPPQVTPQVTPQVNPQVNPQPAPQAARSERRSRAPAASAAGGSNDPFEEFRRKKQKEKELAKLQANEVQRNEAAAAQMGWIEGIGPASNEPHDPNKPRGFTRGRYVTRDVDPNSIQRPAGFQSTKLAPDGSLEDNKPAQVQKPRNFQRF